MEKRTRRAALLSLVGLGTGAVVSGPIDYAGLFAGDPAGPSQNVKFRQGTILSFNPNTLQNTVSVGGATLTDLPVLGVAEASTLVPGAVVGIQVVGEADSAKSMSIIGRSVIPNTPDAVSAITLLNQSIFTAAVLTGETCSSPSPTYTDLATVGPVVTLNVGPSGRILIIASAQIQWAAADVSGAFFDVVFSGANTRNTNEPADPLVGSHENWVTTAGAQTVDITTVTAQAVFSGLNTGVTTVKMVYAKEAAATLNPQIFRRVLTVIKL